MIARRLLVALAMLGTMVACTTEKSGSPTSLDSTGRPSSSARTTGPPSTIPSSSARILPPRPRELDLTGLDPCGDVLTQDQLRKLAYDLGYQRLPQSGKSEIHGGPLCVYASTNPLDQPSRGFSSAISISTSEGAEAWLTDPQRKATADLHRPATVVGFPALVLPHPRFVDNCEVVVDVHAGQYLEVISRPSSGDGGPSPDPFCAEAQLVAEIVVQNLLAR